MYLYRADGRTYQEMKTKYPQGFKAWCPLNINQAKKFAAIFAGSLDITGLPDHLKKHFGNGGNLLDLSAYIKWTKNKTSTVWISTAINTDCGGQGSGGTIYKFNIKLKEYKIQGRSLAALPAGRTSNLQPSLLLDGPSISSSNIIAINHGPRHDAEVAFITTIPLSCIVAYRPKGERDFIDLKASSAASGAVLRGAKKPPAVPPRTYKKAPPRPPKTYKRF